MIRERILKTFGTVVVGLVTNAISDELPARILSRPIDSYMVTFIVTALFAVAMFFDVPRRIWSLFKPHALVVSALVFDGDEILLVKDEGHRPPWFVPPGKHLDFLTTLDGGPHQAVIREVKNAAGVEIEIEGDDFGLGVAKMAQPFHAQCEPTISGDSHERHYDFYYLAHLPDHYSKKKPNGKYEWLKVHTLLDPRGSKIPSDMRKVIDEAFQTHLMHRKDRDDAQRQRAYNPS